MKKYISTTEAAKILGISRIAVFKRIKEGSLPAIKIGRNYAIDLAVLGLKSTHISKKSKNQIDKAVKRVVKEYGEALKKLGKE